MEIGKKIKAVREAKGLMAKEVASTLGLSASVYSRYENDEREPSIELLFKVSKLFGLSVDDLVQYGDEPQEAKVESESAYERTRLIEQLDEKDKEHLDGVINAMINSGKFKELIKEGVENIRH